MNISTKKHVLRYAGNWGTGFFGPLLSSNAAESLFDVGMTFEVTLVIAALSSAFQVGMMISQDAKNASKKL